MGMIQWKTVAPFYREEGRTLRRLAEFKTRTTFVQFGATVPGSEKLRGQNRRKKMTKSRRLFVSS